MIMQKYDNDITQDIQLQDYDNDEINDSDTRN